MRSFHNRSNSYPYILRSLHALVSEYNDYEMDDDPIPSSLIKEIKAKLLQLLPLSLHHQTTHYETAEDDLHQLELCTPCRDTSQAEEDNCPYRVLHEMIGHRVDNLKRLEAEVGMGREEIEEKWRVHAEEKWEAMKGDDGSPW